MSLCGVGECRKPAVYRFIRKAGENAVNDERSSCAAAQCMAIALHRTMDKDKYAALVIPLVLP